MLNILNDIIGPAQSKQSNGNRKVWYIVYTLI